MIEYTLEAKRAVRLSVVEQREHIRVQDREVVRTKGGNFQPLNVEGFNPNGIIIFTRDQDTDESCAVCQRVQKGKVTRKVGKAQGL